MRTFEDKLAVREMTPLLIGLAGPSGSGKTASALRLARGIQRVAGGKIWGIDTEANRMLHYAPAHDEKPDAARLKFEFQHLSFGAPFGPLEYLAAIEHCASRGAGIIIVDSMSHEHEGPGGVLEMHGKELDRLTGSQDKATRDRYNLLAWQKPKGDRRRLINSILQLPINFIFCFRAKDKTKPGSEVGQDGRKKSVMISLGWMPIAGEEFIYEMTVHCLLPPNAGGVPEWNPKEPGEKAMVKLPAQFRDLFSKSLPLSEDIGEQLALWASGGKRVPANWHAQQAAERATVATANAPMCPVDYSLDLPPDCGICGESMRFVSSQQNKGKAAFWSCPNYRQGVKQDIKGPNKEHQEGKAKGLKYTVNAEEHHKRQALRQAEAARAALEQAKAAPEAAQREPGDDSPTDNLPF